MRATDTVEVGRTGLRVTRLGLGGVALSGAPPATDPERATAEKEAVALIQRSLALGVNYLDTAPMYGVGESEARYGEALRGVPRERYVLSTKVGRVLQPPASGGAKATWAFDFSASGVRESFKASLGRLGLERVADGSHLGGRSRASSLASRVHGLPSLRAGGSRCLPAASGSTRAPRRAGVVIRASRARRRYVRPRPSCASLETVPIVGSNPAKECISIDVALHAWFASIDGLCEALDVGVDLGGIESARSNAIRDV